MASNLEWGSPTDGATNQIADLIMEGYDECPRGLVDGHSKPSEAEIKPAVASLLESPISPRFRMVVGYDRSRRPTRLGGLFMGHLQFCALSGRDYVSDSFLFVKRAIRNGRQINGLLDQLGRKDHRVLVPFGSAQEEILVRTGYTGCDQQVLSRKLRSGERQRIGRPLCQRPNRSFIRRQETDYVIRRASSRHMPFLARTWLPNISLKVLGVPFDPIEVRKNLLLMLNQRDPYYGLPFIIERMNGIIGAAKLILEYVPADGSFVAYIRHPFVLRSCQNERACSALTEGILELAAPPSTKEVRIVLPLTDDPAIREQSDKCRDSGFKPLDFGVLARPASEERNTRR